MFLRRLLPLLLIGIGIGLPWLVRSWLAGEANVSPKHAAQMQEGRTVPSNKTKNTTPASASLASTTNSGESNVQESRSPYPLARPGKRLLEGFYDGTSLDSASRKAIPSTPRSRAIVEETTQRIQVDLKKFELECGAPMVLRIFKEENELEIWMQPSPDALYTLFKVARLTASAGGLGPKLHEGDGQTPEGFYAISSRGLRPQTQHHLGLDLGYPNERDQRLGRTGSDLTLHAGTVAAGGFSVSESTMNEVYTLADAALRRGSRIIPVHIFPFRLTDERMDKVVAGRSRWSEEWINLKEGYDFFENVRRAPIIEIAGNTYRFHLSEGKM